MQGSRIESIHNRARSGIFCNRAWLIEERLVGQIQADQFRLDRSDSYAPAGDQSKERPMALAQEPNAG